MYNILSVSENIESTFVSSESTSPVKVIVASYCYVYTITSWGMAIHQHPDEEPREYIHLISKFMVQRSALIMKERLKVTLEISFLSLTTGGKPSLSSFVGLRFLLSIFHI
jgi:hypothetical protein